MMNNEIGSSFYLSPQIAEALPKKSLKSPGILKIHESYVSTCRSAIGLCLDKLCVERKVALLPSFTCESVISPFLIRGYEVYPYPVGRDLYLHWRQFKTAIDQFNPSVILTHPYFGFNTTEELRSHIGEQRLNNGIVFIEDMTQSMFSEFKPLPANFHVGSVRKWLPVPDGAFVTVPFNCDEEDSELVKAKMKALTAKGNYILNGKGDKDSFRNDFSFAERILDSRKRAYYMSSIAREIYARTDIKELQNRRWINYRFLLNSLISDSSLSDKIEVILTNLSSGVCPFHFSVFVKEGRRELQQYLAKNDIYATIIWKCPKEFEAVINDDARYVYDHILCFHVDQRYNIDDMKRILNALKAYYSKA